MISDDLLLQDIAYSIHWCNNCSRETSHVLLNNNSEDDCYYFECTYCKETSIRHIEIEL